MTWFTGSNRGLLGLTEGYWVWQGVTRADRGLLGLTGPSGLLVLQGIMGCDRGHSCSDKGSWGMKSAKSIIRIMNAVPELIIYLYFLFICTYIT